MPKKIKPESRMPTWMVITICVIIATIGIVASHNHYNGNDPGICQDEPGNPLSAHYEC